jgi:hypothetical protein
MGITFELWFIQGPPPPPPPAPAPAAGSGICVYPPPVVVDVVDAIVGMGVVVVVVVVVVVSLEGDTKLPSLTESGSSFSASFLRLPRLIVMGIEGDLGMNEDPSSPSLGPLSLLLFERIGTAAADFSFPGSCGVKAPDGTCGTTTPLPTGCCPLTNASLRSLSDRMRSGRMATLVGTLPLELLNTNAFVG